MKKSTYLLLLYGAILFSVGCASRPGIRLYHAIPPSAEEAEKYAALQNVYIQIEKSSFPELERLAKLIGSAVEKSGEVNAALARVDSHYFAKQFTQGLRRKGGNVLAYRVTSPKETKDPFIKKLNPTGILELSFSSPNLKKGVQGPDGNLYEEGNGSPILASQIRVSVTLKNYPSGKELYTGSYSFNSRLKLGNDGQVNQNDVSSVIRSNTNIIATSLPNQISNVRPFTRFRPIYVDKKNNASKEAYAAARKGHWDQAREFWQGQLNDSPDKWTMVWNLAVADEATRHYDAARERYSQVQEEALKQENTKGYVAEIFSDLEQSVYLKEQGNPGPWFEPRLAVLPLAEEVINISGPEVIQKLAHETLSQGGYNVIPLEESTRLLAENGFSDGGQFRATTPEKLAKWLSADRLLFGYLNEFDETNVGVYVKRSVKGSFSLWDQDEGKKIWETEQVFRNEQINIKEGNILAGFVAGLGKSWLDRLAGTPLGEESQEYILMSLESLPLKPLP